MLKKQCIAFFLAALVTAPMAAAAGEPGTETPSSALAPTPVVSTAPAAQQDTGAASAPPVTPAVPPAAQSAATKIGHVDITRIGQESKRGKAAQTRVKGKADKLKSQLESKQKQLEKQQASIQAKLPTMSQQERVAKAKEFEKKVEEYRKLVQKAENEMKPLQEEAVRSLMNDIKKAAAAYGDANGFTAIVTGKDLLYIGTGALPEDVTDAVIKEMDSKDAGR